MRPTTSDWRRARPVVGLDRRRFRADRRRLGLAEVGLSSAPWVDHPLVFWEVVEIEEAHRALVAAGAVPLGEIADGSLAEIGTADVTNGDPATGIVDVPGGRLGVLRAADSNLVGLHQAVSFA